MHHIVQGAIRTNDADAIRFLGIFKKIIYRNWGIAFSMRFAKTPGGPSYDNRQVFNGHSHCCLTNNNIGSIYREPFENNAEEYAPLIM